MRYGFYPVSHSFIKKNRWAPPVSLSFYLFPNVSLSLLHQRRRRRPKKYWRGKRLCRTGVWVEAATAPSSTSASWLRAPDRQPPRHHLLNSWAWEGDRARHRGSSAAEISANCLRERRHGSVLVVPMRRRKPGRRSRRRAAAACFEERNPGEERERDTVEQDRG